MQFDQKLPFVVYAKPGENRLCALFQRDDFLHLAASFTESGFVFAPFDQGLSVLISERVSEVQKCDFVHDPIVDFFDLEQTNDGKSEYESLVRKAVSAIKDGEFGKVVLSRREETELVDLDFFGLFSNLLNTYRTAFRYCWYHPKIGFWMGATPEKLLYASANVFHTMALAGTQKFNGSSDVDWPEKEQLEQQFVTDFIVDNLKNKISEVVVSKPYTAQAGNLLHIKTDIQGTIDSGADLREIIETLHPTPAVCGLPKALAMKFIIENEGYDREYYSGFLGELHLDGNQNMGADLYVNLRCLQLKENKAYLYMGCGITKDSNPEKEYIETVNKSMTMKKILWK